MEDNRVDMMKKNDMNLIGKENDFVKNKYLIIAVIIAVLGISLSQFFLKYQRSKDYSEFIEKCNFDRIDVISIDELEMKTTIIDKRIICDLFGISKKCSITRAQTEKAI